MEAINTPDAVASPSTSSSKRSTRTPAASKPVKVARAQEAFASPTVMKFIGSKARLVDWLYGHMAPFLRKDGAFADLFAGSGAVARHAALKGDARHVVANDLEEFASVLNHAVLRVPYTPKLARVIERLNESRGRDGLLVQHYASGGRLFLSAANARKADAIRMSLSRMRKDALLTEDEYTFLLA